MSFCSQRMGSRYGLDEDLELKYLCITGLD